MAVAAYREIDLEYRAFKKQVVQAKTPKQVEYELQ